MDALSVAKCLLRLLRAEILRMRSEQNRQRRRSERCSDASGEIATLEYELSDLQRRDVNRSDAMRALRSQVCALESQLSAKDALESKSSSSIPHVDVRHVWYHTSGEEEVDNAPLQATIEQLQSAHKSRLELLDSELREATEGRSRAEEQLRKSTQELAAALANLDAEIEARELLEDRLKRLEASNMPASPPAFNADNSSLASVELQEVWEVNAALEARTRQLAEDQLHAESAAATARQALEIAEERATASTGLMRIARAELSASSSRLSARETDCLRLEERNVMLTRENERLVKRMSAERLHLEAMAALERMARTSGDMLRKVEIAQAILTPN